MISLEDLPPKQQEVLRQIISFIEENGYPPSLPQLCKLCGVSSNSTIHYHLTALKKKGYISGNPSERRAITVHPDLMEKARPSGLPLMGVIAAGSPLQTNTDYIEQIHLPEDLCPPDCYALRVRGSSMIEDHILDEDVVIINPKARVKDGDVVVALVENETATLKRIYREPGRVRLQPANVDMEPIYVQDVQVQGKVEAIIRKLR